MVVKVATRQQNGGSGQNKVEAMTMCCRELKVTVDKGKFHNKKKS